MIARLQRWLVLGSLVIAITWVSAWWTRSPAIAVLGVCVLFFGHAGFLAFEFVASYRIGAKDPIPRASAMQYVMAWIAECLVAPRVFCWQQPFRWASIPDRLQPDERRGAVLIHGFVGNRGFWNPWLRQLRDSGRTFIAVNLEPPFGSIDNYTRIVDEAIVRVTAATGGRPPLLICHSMGGLAARAWLRDADGTRVHRIVTIATPHRGTWLARFGRTTNGREMRMDGEWLQKVDCEQTSARQVPFTCWYSNSDNIVFPPSVATLPGAEIRPIEGQGHVQMAFDERIQRETLALLDRA